MVQETSSLREFLKPENAEAHARWLSGLPDEHRRFSYALMSGLIKNYDRIKKLEARVKILEESKTDNLD